MQGKWDCSEVQGDGAGGSLQGSVPKHCRNACGGGLHAYNAGASGGFRPYSGVEGRTHSAFKASRDGMNPASVPALLD